MPSDLRHCVPALEFTQATKLELTLYHELTKQQRSGLNILDLQGVDIRLPELPSIGRTGGPAPLRWSEFLVFCHDYGAEGITKEFRNFLLETLDMTATRVDDGLDEAVKVMFSSPTYFTGFRGQIYTLRNLADDSRYDGFRFALEVDDYATNRRIDIVLTAPDGRRIFAEVKAYEHWEFDSDDIWTKLLGEYGQFTRDLTGSIERSASIDELFDDLLYFFPDPTQHPNVDLDRVKQEFLNPFKQSGSDYEHVPESIKKAASAKGYALADVELVLQAKLDGMIRTYTTA